MIYKETHHSHFPQNSNENNFRVTRFPLRFLKRNQKNIKGDYAFMVDSGQTSGIKIHNQIRRLTPIECERLMSWPDNWTKWGIDDKGDKIEISDSQRYRQCGNGVCSNVVRAIVKQFI